MGLLNLFIGLLIGVSVASYGEEWGGPVGDVVTWAKHRMSTKAFDNYRHWSDNPVAVPIDGFR